MKPTAKTSLAALCLTALLAGALSACGEAQTPSVSAETAAQTENETEAVTEEAGDKYTDDLGALDFNGAEFRMWTIENFNVTSYIDVAEETGDVFDDSLYRRNRKLEERANFRIVETINPDNVAPIKKNIVAGDDAFDVVGIRCPDALTFYSENLIYNISEVPNIDLSKPYWAQKLNRSITIGGSQYTAIGSFDINVLDLTYALVFNKKLLSDFDLDNPYTLVSDGKWTIDRMYQMMMAVMSDMNGDGVMDENDRWGYFAHPKQVLPNFWIGAGEMSILKDEHDNPYINMTADRFNTVFSRTFEILWDSGAWKSKCDEGHDVPDDTFILFTQDGSMFMDVSLFHLGRLRDMETDFGVLPYPKLDEAQSEYYSRVSYYWANTIPVTNTHLDMTGAVLEMMNCESANTVVPAYYDIALKTKYSRDEESSAMLDLILENRVVDIGDTILCGTIRDGFIYSMFKSNKRDLSSQLAKNEKKIAKEFDKMPVGE